MVQREAGEKRLKSFVQLFEVAWYMQAGVRGRGVRRSAGGREGGKSRERERARARARARERETITDHLSIHFKGRATQTERASERARERERERERARARERERETIIDHLSIHFKGRATQRGHTAAGVYRLPDKNSGKSVPKCIYYANLLLVKLLLVTT
jgi:hypothetical protein